jgi:hypothetical protein
MKILRYSRWRLSRSHGHVEHLGEVTKFAACMNENTIAAIAAGTLKIIDHNVSMGRVPQATAAQGAVCAMLCVGHGPKQPQRLISIQNDSGLAQGPATGRALG